MERDSLKIPVAQILATLGRNGAEFHLEPLSASGNNRVFTLHCDAETLVLKWYFHDATDTRDRLGVEYAFLEHAWNIGLRCIPRPLCKDKSAHLAVYEFAEGRKLQAHEVDASVMQQAAQFFASINSYQSRALASDLVDASEACFSVADHLSMVDVRLERLGCMPIESDVDRSAAEFVSQLSLFWADTKTHILKGCSVLGLNPNSELSTTQRCLSPSDFGFHNALMRSDGSLCFIDFEYAGWDDPAKAVGDFFSHPAVAVPRDQFEPFMEQALAPFENAHEMAARVRLLEPIFQVKWCCIILNEFLPTAARRRNFANPVTDAGARKESQLGKAITLFKSLQH
jgi:hypothetical protein